MSTESQIKDKIQQLRVLYMRDACRMGADPETFANNAMDSLFAMLFSGNAIADQVLTHMIAFEKG